MSTPRPPSYFERLAQRVEQQSNACIGCNDCLLACPLPESRSVTIAELNEAIHLPVIRRTNVASFVAACTQCQQCVPVCPADLSRAEMVVYNKLKVEDTAPDRELLLQARTVTIPSGWTLDGLAEQLPELELFAGVPARDVRRLLLKSTLRFLVPGETLCEQGEFYERLCVVLTGALEQTTQGPSGRVPIVVLAPGSFFGEMGVFGSAPEMFSASALEASVVLEVSRAGVLRLMDQAPAFADRLGQLYSQRALWTYARAAFGALGEQALHELLRGARLQLIDAEEVVFRQGDTPDDVFLVRSGFLRASRQSFTGKERTLVYFREGHVFGVFAQLRHEPSHPYTVRGATRAELVRVRGSALRELLGRYGDAQHALLSRAWDAEELARAPEVGVLPRQLQVPEGSVHQRMSAAVLVEKGIATGREILVVDQHRCTSCGSCVAACERRHGYGRLQLRGLQVDNFLFPTACRHCDDPACLLCNVNGIVRLPSGEIKIVEENCIGCGACAERCPYGNISMHPLHQTRRGLLLSLFDFVAGAGRREQALEAIDPKQQRIAVKCDLCAGHQDYACVTACPVAAMFRVDPGEAGL